MLSECEKFNSSTAVGFPFSLLCLVFGLSIYVSMRRHILRLSSAIRFLTPAGLRFFIPDVCSVPALPCLSYVDVEGGLTR